MRKSSNYYGDNTHRSRSQWCCSQFLTSFRQIYLPSVVAYFIKPQHKSLSCYQQRRSLTMWFRNQTLTEFSFAFNLATSSYQISKLEAVVSLVFVTCNFKVIRNIITSRFSLFVKDTNESFIVLYFWHIFSKECFYFLLIPFLHSPHYSFILSPIQNQNVLS